MESQGFCMPEHKTISSSTDDLSAENRADLSIFGQRATPCLVDLTPLSNPKLKLLSVIQSTKTLSWTRWIRL